MAEENAVLEQEPVVDQMPEDTLPQQHEDHGPSGEANPGQAQEPKAQQEPVPQQGNPSWFKPEQFQLKYRGQTVGPKDYNHAVQLMQQGWSYSQAMSQVNQMKKEIEGQKGRFSSYEQLEQAFQQNPQFAQKIWALYRESQGQQAPQYSPQDAVAHPQYQQLYETVNQMQERLKQFDEVRADQDVEREIQDLRSKFASVNWDQMTETGHSMLYDVLSHAHSNKFPNLMAAARDYLWDSQVANAKMAGAEQSAQQRQKNARAGVVSNGAPAPSASRGSEVRGSSYDDLTKMALKDLGLVK